MINFLVKHKIKLWVIFIIGLALFLRVYRLTDTYVFNLDEEYQATIAWTLIKDFHPIWIGVSSSFLDFYLGPYFTYFTALLLWISKGDPLSTAYFAALVGTITTGALFFIGRKLFNLTTAVVSSLLYATLPVLVFFDQKYWNTMFVPIVTLLLFLTIYLIKKSAWYWVLFAAIFGAILETHLEPTPLLLIGFFYFFKGGYFKRVKIVLVSFLVFALFYWPLAVFDYYHNFSNIGIFTRFGQGVSESKVTFNPVAKMKTLTDSMGRYWYLNAGNPNADEINFGCTSLSVKQEFSFIDQYAKRTYSTPVLSLITLAMVLYFFKIALKEKDRQYKLLGIFLIVSIISFLLFPGGSSEYYALFFLVLFTFIPGILISRMKDKSLRILVILFVVAVSLLGINTVMKTSDEFSLGPKRILIAKVMEVVGDKPFSIEGRGVCHDYEGWRFLFKVYGRQPVQSYTDRNLGWLYPEEIGKDGGEYTVILSEDRIPLKEDLSNLPSIKEGGYRAYIKKN